MERTVTAYGPGAVKVSGYVDGTSFFPGGSGLWQGPSPHGRLPEFFPEAPVMLLGHNFDSVQGHADSVRRGVERMRQGTWKHVLSYLDKAGGIVPEQCFFTNVFVGLQPIKAEGKMKGSELYERECRNFLAQQIKIVRPRLIATLGITAEEQLKIIRPEVPCVALLHPGNLRFKKKQEHESILRQQGELLVRASGSSCSPPCDAVNADSLRE